jgi:hypothetical protein
MKIILISISLLLVFAFPSKKDINADILNGKWKATKFQAIPAEIMSGNNFAEEFMSTEITIGDSLIIEAGADLMFLSPRLSCKYKVNRILKLNNPVEFLEERYTYKAKLWGIDNSKDVYLFAIYCPEAFFDLVIYNNTDDVLMIETDSFVFTFKHLE